MAIWAIVALGAGVLLLIVALGFGAWLGWRNYQRRALMRLVVRREAVESSAQALIEVISRLAVASDEDLRTFADSPTSTERRVLIDLAHQAELTTDELDRMPLPRSLVGAASALADAAHVIAGEARKLRDEDVGTAALEKIGELDLDLVRGYVAQARRRVGDACADCGLEETNVYGGGLYL